MMRLSAGLMVAAALTAGAACSSDGGDKTGTGGAGAGGTGGTAGTGSAGTSGNAGTTGGAGTGGSLDGTFACGPTARCMAYHEYCFFEEWNGAVKVDYVCRPLPANCTACGCARPDAAAASMRCTTPSSLRCSDSQDVLDDQTTSPILNLWCLIA